MLPSATLPKLSAATIFFTLNASRCLVIADALPSRGPDTVNAPIR